MVLGQLGIHTQKINKLKKFTSCIKINSKSITDLNVKLKTIKPEKTNHRKKIFVTLA